MRHPEFYIRACLMHTRTRTPLPNPFPHKLEGLSTKRKKQKLGGAAAQFLLFSFG
jgi:hypothetical protein